MRFGKVFIVFTIIMGKMGRKLLYLIMMLLLLDIAMAATIQGTVYSFDLEKRNNSIISVNSIPAQTVVAKDGTYKFELGLGEYIITERYSELGEIESVTERVKVAKEGNFILDLILFPSFEAEESLLLETEESVVGDEVFQEGIGRLTIIMFAFALAGIVVIGFVVFKYSKILKKVTKEVEKTSKEMAKAKVSGELERKVLDFIKEEGGRVTQKDIRKKFTYSEAKISLVISDLESKDIVKRVKKGRGNIIILK